MGWWKDLKRAVGLKSAEETSPWPISDRERVTPIEFHNMEKEIAPLELNQPLPPEEPAVKSSPVLFKKESKPRNVSTVRKSPASKKRQASTATRSRKKATNPSSSNQSVSSGSDDSGILETVVVAEVLSGDIDLGDSGSSSDSDDFTGGGGGDFGGGGASGSWGDDSSSSSSSDSGGSDGGGSGD